MCSRSVRTTLPPTSTWSSARRKRRRLGDVADVDGDRVVQDLEARLDVRLGAAADDLGLGVDALDAEELVEGDGAEPLLALVSKGQWTHLVLAEGGEEDELRLGVVVDEAGGDKRLTSPFRASASWGTPFSMQQPPPFCLQQPPPPPPPFSIQQPLPAPFRPPPRQTCAPRRESGGTRCTGTGSRQTPPRPGRPSAGRGRGCAAARTGS